MAIKRINQITADSDALDVFDTLKDSVANNLTLKKATNKDSVIANQVFLDQSDKSLNKFKSNNNNTSATGIFTLAYSFPTFDLRTMSFNALASNQNTRTQFENTLTTTKGTTTETQNSNTPTYNDDRRLVTHQDLKKFISNNFGVISGSGTAINASRYTTMKLSAFNPNALISMITSSDGSYNPYTMQWSFKSPEGLIKKYGITYLSQMAIEKNSHNEITFSEPFPNMCINIQFTIGQNYSGDNLTVALSNDTTVNAKSSFKYFIRNTSNKVVKAVIMWEAIGF